MAKEEMLCRRIITFTAMPNLAQSIARRVARSMLFLVRVSAPRLASNDVRAAFASDIVLHLLPLCFCFSCTAGLQQPLFSSKLLLSEVDMMLQIEVLGGEARDTVESNASVGGEDVRVPDTLLLLKLSSIIQVE